jgi:hypothetical protein
MTDHAPKPYRQPADTWLAWAVYWALGMLFAAMVLWPIWM